MNDLRRCEQRGFSLIEIMVGLVIGLISVLVIYQVFAAAEGIKRNTTSVGDAQQNGLLSSFILNIELANASNGIADAMAQLGTCNATADPATSMRPIPLLIIDGGATHSDRFVVNYSVAQRRTTPANASTQGANYIVQSLNGFSLNDLIVAIDGAGNCAPSVVSAAPTAVPCLAPDDTGCVQVTPLPIPPPLATTTYLLNLGPTTGGVTQRVQYDVNAGMLESTVLWGADGQPLAVPTGNPIASNVVNLKLLYGIDNGAGGVTWTPATGAWSSNNVLQANTTTLGQIKAVRMGIVVRGEQWDQALGDQTWTLFADTPVPLTGTIAAANGNYRMRTYETIIPLRNSLWNPTS